MLEVDSLNDYQKAAVSHSFDQPLRILAGPGSGKTATLTVRVGEMLRKGIHPHNLCVFTFTNKAANEMKTRIQKHFPAQANKLLVTTFHSFCLRSLKENKEIDKNASILSEKDCKDIVKQCYLLVQQAKEKQKLRETGQTLDGFFSGKPGAPVLQAAKTESKTSDEIDLTAEDIEGEIIDLSGDMKIILQQSKRIPGKKVVKAALDLKQPKVKTKDKDQPDDEEIMRVAKQQKDRVEQLTAFIHYAKSNGHSYSEYVEEEREVFRLYEEIKQKIRAIDFNDMLLMAAAMLKRKEVAEKFSKRFQYLMVDEFQDTNNVQFDVIKALAPHGRVTVVGDQNQSI
eukprot:TRINITY_DN22164_c0_g1_i1.p1 TRINITY_DN22164_c0_g1~~TRINITY_DN22164_c0_g1_i1.p1  ORF type:complete len:341 (+),score=96.23 TRINITY_DN22164_c0_g1_i1:45-1067(+)